MKNSRTDSNWKGSESAVEVAGCQKSLQDSSVCTRILGTFLPSFALALFYKVVDKTLMKIIGE